MPILYSGSHVLKPSLDSSERNQDPVALPINTALLHSIILHQHELVQCAGGTQLKLEREDFDEVEREEGPHDLGINNVAQSFTSVSKDLECEDRWVGYAGIFIGSRESESESVSEKEGDHGHCSGGSRDLENISIDCDFEGQDSNSVVPPQVLTWASEGSRARPGDDIIQPRLAQQVAINSKKV
jgi:hypothetical protein